MSKKVLVGGGGWVDFLNLVSSPGPDFVTQWHLLPDMGQKVKLEIELRVTFLFVNSPQNHCYQ